MFFIVVSDDDFSNPERGGLSSQPPNRPPRPEASKPAGHQRGKRQVNRLRPGQDLRLLHAAHVCGQYFTSVGFCQIFGHLDI